MNEKTEEIMKSIIKILMPVFILLQLSTVLASEDISGAWKGILSIGPDTEMTVQFVIEQDGHGSYSAAINSLEWGSTEDIEANTVIYDSGRLKIDVAELSGAYEGIFADGKIEGKWMQEGTSFPLILTPLKSLQLSKEDMEKLSGEWHGELSSLTGPSNPFLIFRFNITENGELDGQMDLVQSGQSNLPVDDFQMTEDGEFLFRMPTIKAVYKGKIGDDEIVGGYQPQPGMSFYPQILRKGKYAAQEREEILPKEIMDKLVGNWKGKVGSSDVLFRFERTMMDLIMGFIEIPDQGIKEMPFTGSDFKDGKLTLKSEFIKAEFNGQLSEDEIAGDWTQGGNKSPISLTKEMNK